MLSWQTGTAHLIGDGAIAPRYCRSDTIRGPTPDLM